MSRISRRKFTAAALATLSTTAMSSSVAEEEGAKKKLPTVRWGNHEISKLLVGHNPLKGVSHFTAELSREMRDWFDADPRRGVDLLQRCEDMGINTCQMGGEKTEELLQKHYARGGQLQWIATFYSKPGEGKEELARILRMRPKPIGIQQLGNTTDRLMREGKIRLALDNLRMFRDAGVLVGLGTHNHEVIDHVEDQGWDIDFYQCSFYRSWFGLDRSRRGEFFEEEARQSMVRTIQNVSRPCIAFKVLGANRHCHSPAAVEHALQFAFANVKPSDVILVGMWHKYGDQVGENTEYVRRILAAERDPKVTNDGPHSC